MVSLKKIAMTSKHTYDSPYSNPHHSSGEMVKEIVKNLASISVQSQKCERNLKKSTQIKKECIILVMDKKQKNIV